MEHVRINWIHSLCFNKIIHVKYTILPENWNCSEVITNSQELATGTVTLCKNRCMQPSSGQLALVCLKQVKHKKYRSKPREVFHSPTCSHAYCSYLVSTTERSILFISEFGKKIEAQSDLPSNTLTRDWNY